MKLEMSRHVGAIRILSLELLGFKNLLSFASHQSLRIPTDVSTGIAFGDDMRSTSVSIQQEFLLQCYESKYETEISLERRKTST